MVDCLKNELGSWLGTLVEVGKKEHRFLSGFGGAFCELAVDG